MNRQLQLLSRYIREARRDYNEAVEMDDIDYAEQAITDRRIAQYRMANCELDPVFDCLILDEWRNDS